MHEILSVDSQENYFNCCHQMPDFKAKMHQIQFRLGLRPRPRWESLQHSPDPLAGFKGGLLLRGWKGREGEVVKLPRKFLTLIFAVLLPFFCCTMLCKRGLSRHPVSVRLSARVSVTFVHAFC